MPRFDAAEVMPRTGTLELCARSSAWEWCVAGGSLKRVNPPK